MKKLTIIIFVLMVLSLGGAALSKNISGKVAGVSSFIVGNNLRKATLSIDGMYCASCAIGSQYNLKAIDGVSDAYVGFTDGLNGEGWVVYDYKKVNEEQIIKAVEPYKATIVSNTVYTEK